MIKVARRLIIVLSGCFLTLLVLLGSEHNSANNESISSSTSVITFEKIFGGSDIDEGYSVAPTSDGGYIVVGNTSSFGAGGSDVYLLKIDAIGNKKWEKTFGGSGEDLGRSVSQTRDGGYVIVGTTYSFGAGSADVYLIKTDSEGNKIWEKTFGGKDFDFGDCVAQTRDGGYVIVGSTDSFGAGKSDVYLIKTDSDGNKIWEKTFGGKDFDDGYSITQTNDGGYVIVGKTESFGAGSADVYLIKTDSDGNKIWEKTFGGKGFDWGFSVAQSSDGGYIVAGLTYSHMGGSNSAGVRDSDVYLIKTDSEGNKIWEKTFGSKGYDEVGYSVVQTSDGGYIIASKTRRGEYLGLYLVKTDTQGNKVWEKIWGGLGGFSFVSVSQTSDGGYVITGSTKSFGLGKPDIYLVKTDPAGNKIWEKIFGGSAGDLGCSIALTSDGGYIMVGKTDSIGAGGFDVYLIKTDAQGNKIWEKTFGGSDDDWGNWVAQTRDGGYIIVGTTRSFGAGKEDVYLVKTDSDGNKVWEKTFGGEDADTGECVVEAKDGGYVIVGSTESFGAGSDDVYVIKTDSEGNEIWEKTFGSEEGDEGHCIRLTSDGGYIIVGETHISAGANYASIYLIKIDALGNRIWEKSFGGKYTMYFFGRSVTQVSDGGYVIVGGILPTSGKKMELHSYLIKTDSKGNKIWEKTLGGENQGCGFAVAQANDNGGYIIVEAMVSGSCPEGYGFLHLIKTDSKGNKIWEKTFRGMVSISGTPMAQTKDNGYILVATDYPYTKRTDIFLIKTDSQGNFQKEGR
jgi:hypothetical protein